MEPSPSPLPIFPISASLPSKQSQRDHTTNKSVRYSEPQETRLMAITSQVHMHAVSLSKTRSRYGTESKSKISRIHNCIADPHLRCGFCGQRVVFITISNTTLLHLHALWPHDILVWYFSETVWSSRV